MPTNCSAEDKELVHSDAKLVANHEKENDVSTSGKKSSVENDTASVQQFEIVVFFFLLSCQKFSGIELQSELHGSSPNFNDALLCFLDFHSLHNKC